MWLHLVRVAALNSRKVYTRWKSSCNSNNNPTTTTTTQPRRRRRRRRRRRPTPTTTTTTTTTTADDDDDRRHNDSTNHSDDNNNNKDHKMTLLTFWVKGLLGIKVPQRWSLAVRGQHPTIDLERESSSMPTLFSTCFLPYVQALNRGLKTVQCSESGIFCLFAQHSAVLGLGLSQGPALKKLL